MYAKRVTLPLKRVAEVQTGRAGYSMFRASQNGAICELRVLTAVNTVGNGRLPAAIAQWERTLD